MELPPGQPLCSCRVVGKLIDIKKYTRIESRKNWSRAFIQWDWSRAIETEVNYLVDITNDATLIMRGRGVKSFILYAGRKFGSLLALLIIGSGGSAFARVDFGLGRRGRRLVSDRCRLAKALDFWENGIEIAQWRKWNRGLRSVDRREFDAL